MSGVALLLAKVHLNTFVYDCIFWYRFVLHFIPIMNMNMIMTMTLIMTMRVSLKRFRKRVVGKNL